MQKNALLLPSALFLMVRCLSITAYCRQTQSAKPLQTRPSEYGNAKRIVIASMPEDGQINTIVTKARTAFDGTGFSQIGIIALRAEQNTVTVSNGNIGSPKTDLQDLDDNENTEAVICEIAFYDEKDPCRPLHASASAAKQQTQLVLIT